MSEFISMQEIIRAQSAAAMREMFMSEENARIHEWTKACREIIRRCAAPDMERAAFDMLQLAIGKAVLAAEMRAARCAENASKV